MTQATRIGCHSSFTENAPALSGFSVSCSQPHLACFPILQYADHVRNFPQLRGDASRHCRSAAKRLMNADEIVIHEVQRDRVSVVLGFFGGSGSVLAVVHLIDDLAGGDIDNELAELERIARMRETMCCHAESMALGAGRSTTNDGKKSLTTFKLDHYPQSGFGQCRLCPVKAMGHEPARSMRA